MRVVETKKVCNLVYYGGLNLAPELGRRPKGAQQGAGEDRDPVRQMAREVVRSGGERHALIEAEERGASRIQAEVAKERRRRLVLDHHRDVLKKGGKLGRDLVERVDNQPLELRSLHGHTRRHLSGEQQRNEPSDGRNEQHPCYPSQPLPALHVRGILYSRLRPFKAATL